MNKKEKRKQNQMENRKMLWPILLAICLITANFIGGKYTNLANQINVSNSVLIYPISFLIVILMMRTFDKKYAKKAIYISVIAQVLFIIGLTLVSFLRSNDDSTFVRAYIEYLFTPNSSEVFGLTFSYPNIIIYVFSIGAFIFSHIIAIKLYDSTINICPDVFSFGITFFISYLIDSIIYTAGFNTVTMLMDDKWNFTKLIRILTGQFIGVFATGIIMIIIYCIVIKFIKPATKEVIEEKIETPKPEVVKIVEHQIEDEKPITITKQEDDLDLPVLK